MSKITDIVHLLIKEESQEKSIIIDATCGNGLDTLFLAKLNPLGIIRAYDIQDGAIEKTKALTKDYCHIEYYHDTFLNMNLDGADIVLFNLGYLPNGDKNIVTKAQDTLKITKKIVSYMDTKQDLKLFMVVYPKHEEGSKESKVLLKYTMALDPYKYEVLKISPINQKQSPYILKIQRKH